LRDLRLVHGLSVAIDEQNFVAGRGESLQQKHPQVWHEVSSHTIVGIVEKDSHDGSVVEIGRASPHEDVTSDAENWRLGLGCLIEMAEIDRGRIVHELRGKSALAYKMGEIGISDWDGAWAIPFADIEKSIVSGSWRTRACPERSRRECRPDTVPLNPGYNVAGFGERKTMRGKVAGISIVVLLSLSMQAQQAPLSKTVQKYVRVNAPKVILEHVRVIDGTGKPAVDDQNVVIEGGKIAAVQAGADVTAGAGTTVLDLRGYSVMPGIVGMHDHLFYVGRPNFDAEWKWEPPVAVPQMSFSAPRLYLAGGVTTMRTTGSVETYADLNLKHEIDGGELPGPHMDVTGPYLEGSHSYFLQMHWLSSADEARQMVDYWADRGVTSFKAYAHITRAELSAAVKEAHKRGLKITGHLCSITYEEAAEIGIDNLEHGFFVNTSLDPDKTPDTCTASSRVGHRISTCTALLWTSTLSIAGKAATNFRIDPPTQMPCNASCAITTCLLRRSTESWGRTNRYSSCYRRQLRLRVTKRSGARATGQFTAQKQ